MFKNYFIAILLACGSPLFAQKNVQTELTKISHSVSEKESVESIFDSSLFPFYHGVASGDPTTSSVIIWTRVSPTTDADVTVTWKVASDPQLQNVVKQSSLVTNVSKDYTVKVDVTGLQANKTYYYGFNALGKNSATGRTRTVLYPLAMFLNSVLQLFHAPITKMVILMSMTVLQKETILMQLFT